MEIGDASIHESINLTLTLSLTLYCLLFLTIQLYTSALNGIRIFEQNSELTMVNDESIKELRSIEAEKL